MDFIDEQNRTGLIVQGFQYRLQPLFEISPVLRTRKQGPHVQGIDRRIPEYIRHIAGHDVARQTFGERGLAHSGLAHEQRVVLSPPAEDLDRPLEFHGASDQGIDASLFRQLVQIDGIVFKGTVGLFIPPFPFVFVLLLRCRQAVPFRHLGDAVGNVVHHVVAADLLLAQEIYREGLPFTEHRHEDVGALDLLLARALHMHDGSLQHPLKPETRLRLVLAFRLELRHLVFQVLLQRLLEDSDIPPAQPYGLAGLLVIQQRVEQVLHGDDLVPAGTGVVDRRSQGDFKFFGQHGLCRNGRKHPGLRTGRKPAMPARTPSCQIHGALQGMLVFHGIVDHQLDLGFGNLSWKHPTDTDAPGMHMQHYLLGPGLGHMKDLHQQFHHEFHRGVVIVVQQDLVHRWLLELRFAPLDNQSRAGTVIAAGLLLVGHLYSGHAGMATSRAVLTWLRHSRRRLHCRPLPGRHC